jgi:hypothetical protein
MSLQFVQVIAKQSSVHSRQRIRIPITPVAPLNFSERCDMAPKRIAPNGAHRRGADPCEIRETTPQPMSPGVCLKAMNTRSPSISIKLGFFEIVGHRVLGILAVLVVVVFLWLRVI